MRGRAATVRVGLGAQILALFAVLAALACAPPPPPLTDPDPGLAELALLEVGPRILVPGSRLLVRGRALPGPGDGALSLRLTGTVRPRAGSSRPFEVRLRAEHQSETEAVVPVGSDLYAALGTLDGTVEAEASLVVDSAIDLQVHRTAPIRATLELRRTLSPRLDSVDLAGSQRGTGRVHVNDWVMVRGAELLLGGEEGTSAAVLSGCFLADGLPEPCSKNGRSVLEVEIPITVPTQAPSSLDRTTGVFPYAPALHGITPGRFFGTVALKNTSPLGVVRSDGRAIQLRLVAPELTGINPPRASLGQYVEMRGGGFVGGQPGQATLVRLVGRFNLEGSPIQIPVDLEIVVQPLLRYPDGPIGRYVLDETDALGQALEPRGGLREASGTFVGTAMTTLRYGRETVSSKPTPVELAVLPPKQVVLVTFLPSYQDSLRLFGLRAVDNAVRARVLDVARRDYAGINIEFREVRESAPPPSDFAYYAQVEIGGPDPNGLGYLGYDNTPGRDRNNRRLYDRIGGVNAVTQSDGSPGYGGVFSEQLLGFSAHPGTVAQIKTAAQDSELFDAIFDPLRPDVGGQQATVKEGAALPALSSGSLCPVQSSGNSSSAPSGSQNGKIDRGRQVACAIFVLGSLIGTTMTHELGHSLGLANPTNPQGSYHNVGDLPGRIMNPGGLRSFRERAELLPTGPAVFCDTDYEYLRRILPGPGVAPPASERPPCLDSAPLAPTP